MKLGQIYLTYIIFESWYRVGYLPMHHINNVEGVIPMFVKIIYLL